MTEHRPERRTRNLTEDDIEAIIRAIDERHGHVCRFNRITEDDVYESVKFFKYLNEIMTNGRNIAAKTVLVLLITFLFGVLGAGIVSKWK